MLLSPPFVVILRHTGIEKDIFELAAKSLAMILLIFMVISQMMQSKRNINIMENLNHIISSPLMISIVFSNPKKLAIRIHFQK